jgi:intein/homing endonuclease
MNEDYNENYLLDIIACAMLSINSDDFESLKEEHKSFIELSESLKSIRFESFEKEINRIRHREFEFIKAILDDIRETSFAYEEGDNDKLISINQKLINIDKEVNRFCESKSFDMLLETNEDGLCVINISKEHLKLISLIIEKYYDVEDALGEREAQNMLGSKYEFVMRNINEISDALKLVLGYDN